MSSSKQGRHVRAHGVRRGTGLGMALCVALALAPATAARAADSAPAAPAAQASAAAAVPEFPGVRNAPDPGDLGYDGWFEHHQPVKIVFGVGSPGGSGFKESLHNAALSIQYLRLKHIAYKIEIVLYGNAVKAADPLNQEYANLGDLMQALNDVGVKFVVCYNSMGDVGMHRGDVYPYMTLVPAGILELARREAEGYAYIRNF